MDLTILANIFVLAHVGALDAKALDVVCAARGADPVLTATLLSARAATEAAVAAALAPFGVQPHDKVPGSEPYITADGRTVTYYMDYATGARVYGPLLIGGAS